MTLAYSVIEIFTSEEIRHQGKPLYQAIVQHVHDRKIAARCVVLRGIAGCYESGEVATHGIEVLSFNLPLKIEIILPSAELPLLLPEIEAMVEDGIVLVEEQQAVLHRTRSRLLPRQLKVRDVMAPQPQTVGLETTADAVAQLLLESEFNGVPVVDASGRAVGIITQGDLIQRAQLPVRLGLLAELEHEQIDEVLRQVRGHHAREIMSQPVVSVGEDERLSAAVALMLEKNLKRLPVVDEKGKLAGMLARVDIFRAIAQQAPDWHELARAQVRVENIRYVADIMRRDTETVHPAMPVAEVIRLIDRNDLQRVAVVDEAGKLLGLISDRLLLPFFSERGKGWRGTLGKLWRHEPDAASLAGKTAASIMTKDLATVREQTPIDEAIRLMLEKKIKRLPVVDEQGIFKGLISRDSLLRAGM